MIFLFLLDALARYCDKRHFLFDISRKNILKQLASVHGESEMKLFILECGNHKRFYCRKYKTSQLDMPCLNVYLNLYKKDDNGILLRTFFAAHHNFIDIQPLNYLLVKSVLDRNKLLFDIVMDPLKRMRFNITVDFGIKKIYGMPEWANFGSKYSLLDLAYSTGAVNMIWKILPYYEEFHVSRVQLFPKDQKKDVRLMIAKDGHCASKELIIKGGDLYISYSRYWHLFTLLSLSSNPDCHALAREYYGIPNRRLSKIHDDYLLSDSRLKEYATLDILGGSLTSSFEDRGLAGVATNMKINKLYYENARLSSNNYWQVVVLNPKYNFNKESKNIANRTPVGKILYAASKIDFDVALFMLSTYKSKIPHAAKYIEFGITQRKLKFMVKVTRKYHRELRGKTNSDFDRAFFRVILEEQKWEYTELAVFVAYANDQVFAEVITAIDNDFATHIKEIVTAEHECIICTEFIETIDLEPGFLNSGILRCGHAYHSDCIYKWSLSKMSCPICKAPI